MFNEKYGLQTSVLEGRKTMTRRIANMNDSSYCKGDIVAIAQRYSELTDELIYESDDILKVKQFAFEKGWRNKMFVKAELMPHHIRITDVKVEHLQDITEEDCIKEGIGCTHGGYGVVFYINYNVFAETPHEAFASLIDKISGKGTWERNPLVYVYEFELID